MNQIKPKKTTIIFDMVCLWSYILHPSTPSGNTFMLYFNYHRLLLAKFFSVFYFNFKSK